MRNTKWQSISIDNSMQTHELMNVSFTVDVEPYNELALSQATKANIPWARDHFLERVSGKPLNPGQQWLNWPWSNRADKFRDSRGQFSHTYMERIWPKYAGLTEGGQLEEHHILTEYQGRIGIRYSYGDLNDVVNHLQQDKESRQAFLPIWFPEDTGIIHGERVPCTLGYLFLIRENRLHMVYYLRSCDFIRHFGDDCYLSVRLQEWVRGRVDPTLRLGTFTAHIASMHVFRNDFLNMKKGKL